MGGEGTSSVSSDLGAILAVLRTGRGWSQAKLARESGIPASSISQYEMGKKLPEMLPEVKSLYSRFFDELNMARLRWVEGRIVDGLGRTNQGIEILAQVRGEFASRSMHYDTALISLELAMIFARKGRTDQVKALARHMTPIFQAQGIHREAMAALALFRQSAESDNVTVSWTRRLLEYLHRARHDPELRFEAQS
jgi:transcriptional regulator with XRE-family HTH domain